MIVVKIGGSIADACPDLIDELATREDVVLVHGFGPQTDQACHEAGIEPRTLRSPDGMTSRFTDRAVIDAMRTAAEQTQRDLSQRLTDAGAPVDPMGVEVPLVWAKAKPVLRHAREDGRVLLVRGNRSGRVADVAIDPVETALSQGRLPLVTPLGLDEAGTVSVDADRAAAALAGRLEADALILLTDVPGLLADRSDPGTCREAIPVDRIEALVGETVTGGMARKLIAAREAIEAGVDRVLIGDGRRGDPVAGALAGDATEVHP